VGMDRPRILRGARIASRAVGNACAMGCIAAGTISSSYQEGSD
jgi:hypothetical protein